MTSSANADGEEFQGFDPFSAAERAAEEAIEGILIEGGEALYSRYIEQKSFCYAADVISNLLVQELRMCFVPFDRGEVIQQPSNPSPSPPPPSRLLLRQQQQQPPLHSPYLHLHLLPPLRAPL
mmetsp:Transcript_40050/g.85796  ORF Transcript_40050/g.85796 Transcript_40050/m.85796 type:complete len:123 (+) Transcript_40050:83-451(+)